MCTHGVSSQVALEQATIVASTSVTLLRGSSDACPYSESGATDRKEEELAAESDLLQLDEEVYAPSLPEVPAIPPGTYVISVQKRTSVRRLHIQGRCPYRAGVDYTSFEVAGPSEPASDRFTARCKKCFKDAIVAAVSDADSSVDSSSSSS